MTEFRITKFRREGGYYRARVTPATGDTVEVHRRYGSWMRDVPGGMKELPREISAALAVKVRQLERREREALDARRAAAVASGRVPCAVASPLASPGSSASAPLDRRVRVRVLALDQAA